MRSECNSNKNILFETRISSTRNVYTHCPYKESVLAAEFRIHFLVANTKLEGMFGGWNVYFERSFLRLAVVWAQGMYTCTSFAVLEYVHMLIQCCNLYMKDWRSQMHRK